MTARNFSQYKTSFSELCDIATDNAEPVIIVRDDSENLVLMTESEYNSITETLYLMRSPANYQNLMKAFAEEDAITMTLDELLARNN